ncbi:MAG: hypothetical protein ACYTG2_16400 [Planctomycetota bacterium]
MLRLAPLSLLAALTVAVHTGCASNSERWAEGSFPGVSYSVLYNVVLTTVDAEGFVVRYRDPQKGAFESEWVYGTSQRVVRGPSRRKVYARIVREADDRYMVRLRVAEEVVRKGGLMAVGVRESEDWEPFEDNYEDAEYLMAKLVALVRSEGTQRTPVGEEAVTP